MTLVTEIFNVEKYCELEIWVRSHSVIEIGTIRENEYGFLLVFYSNFSRKKHSFLDIGTCKYTVTLKPVLRFVQGHQN